MLCPGVPGLGCAYAHHQKLLPQEPSAVAFHSQAYLSGTVSTAAFKPQGHISLVQSRVGITLNLQCKRLCRCVVIVRGCALEIRERHIPLIISESVVKERNLIRAQRTGATQEVEHLYARCLVCTIGAKCKHAECSCFERRVKCCLGQSLKLPYTLGQFCKGKGFFFASYWVKPLVKVTLKIN